ncbi:MAG: DUF488 domain-containing protein [Candidatus Nezhaarchaeota archaeon]|nr:DUF488 domain-containing protein [Candidatus Nezhaarchaeota archaeon]
MILVYDVGYGRFKSVSEFLGSLLSRNVSVVVDVRAFPRSKIQGFCKGDLERALKESGLEYLWMGRELGGFRKITYSEYANSEEFESSLKRLIELAKVKRTCIMCLEKRRDGCHRRFIVARLEERGFRVEDLVDGGIKKHA